MRKGVKKHSRRARMREILYSLAIDAAWLVLGTSIAWGPIVLQMAAGWLIDLLGL